MKYIVFNMDAYEEKLVLCFSLISKIVDRGNVNLQCMGKMHDDLNVICLTLWS